MSNKNIIYTCITGNVDSLHELKPQAGCKYVCFSETAWHSNVWEVRPLLKTFPDNSLTARWHKTQVPFHVHSDKYLWQDGKVTIHNVISLFQELGSNDFLLYEHPLRHCIYTEAKRVIELGKERGHKVRRQITHYREEQHKTKHLFETCVLAFNRTKAVLDVLTKWWAEIETYSTRDQLSLPYVLQNCQVSYKLLQDPYRSKFFSVSHHFAQERELKFL